MRPTHTDDGIAPLALIALAVIVMAVPAALACTAFCFDTPDGPVFGANMDLAFGDGLVFVNRRGVAKTGYMLNSEGEPLRWTSRHGSVSFNLVGIELPWGGMNEAGLVASSMSLSVTGYPPADARYPVSSATWVQYLLDTCATIDEVIAVQDSLRLRGDPVHFLVADPTGTCVIVEWLDGETVIHAGEDLPVRALANATYRDCLRYLEDGTAPSFNPGRSAERVAAAAHWTGQYDPDGDVAATDWALGVLTEAVVDPKSWWKDLFNEPYTQWSIAYDIPARVIHFRTEESPGVRRLDLANLDFACEAPVLMMDVNAELAGPVEAALQPYDADWNYDVAHHFLDEWGSELRDEQVAELIAFLEGFACAP
jgi:choloylglycine hydrolase